jgi:PhnB protein
VSVYLHVHDATLNRRSRPGAKARRPIADEFYGDRVGGLEDPFGHVLRISTRMDDLSAEDIGKRAVAAAGSDLFEATVGREKPTE